MVGLLNEGKSGGAHWEGSAGRRGWKGTQGHLVEPWILDLRVPCRVLSWGVVWFVYFWNSKNRLKSEMWNQECQFGSYTNNCLSKVLKVTGAMSRVVVVGMGNCGRIFRDMAWRQCHGDYLLPLIYPVVLHMKRVTAYQLYPRQNEDHLDSSCMSFIIVVKYNRKKTLLFIKWHTLYMKKVNALLRKIKKLNKWTCLPCS